MHGTKMSAGNNLINTNVLTVRRKPTKNGRICQSGLVLEDLRVQEFFVENLITVGKTGFW